MDAEKSPRTAYRFDRFTLDLARAVLSTSDGVELPLRPKSFALLQLLVENAGLLLGRDAILSAVWPDVIVSDDSITQCVHDIRRALGGDAQRLLRTVQRRGYLFAAAVSRADPAIPLVTAGDEPKEASRDGRLKETVGYPLTSSAPGEALGPPSQQLSLRSDLDRVSEGHPGPEETEPVRLSLPPGAERRHLTVLFCDLAGLSALSEQVDPEDLASIIRVYREHCVAAIAHCGGHIESYAGDRMLAFFGYPQAREDAAERSVRAGIAIVEATHDLHPSLGLALQVRAGIATGLVVNDEPSQGVHGQIVGKPLNLAARLLAIAEPGTVIIADSTRRLVGGLFALEDLGSHPLKGFTAPVRAWRVTGDGVAESRFNALRGTNFIPLVGREQELTLLLDRWEQAREGEGQVVLLVGEPGIGKSRLVQALRDGLTDAPHVYLGCYCSPHRLDTPLQPVIAQLERAANFTHGDNPGQKLAKLETLLAQRNEDTTQLAPLIASLLSIPSDAYPPGDMSPRLQRERTLAALVSQLAGLSAHRPVLLVWEDVHWADPTSLELLRLAIDRLQSLPVLAVITFRPGFAPPWPGHTHVTSLTLNRLSRRRSGQLVAGLTGDKSLPQVVIDQIVACAEGVPLFVEELTKQVLESGLLREEDERYELAGPLPRTAIPATLQDSLMARLDRCGSAKAIAQVAAVIGREFSHDLLAAIISQQEELAEALHQLIGAELVFRRGMAPHVTYVFKHALVRDVAYASLLTGERRQLHTRIAQELEEYFGHVAKVEPDVLAHHWTEAAVVEKAAVYRLKAGERALAHSAMTEAIAQLTMGQALLQSLPEDDERRRRELDLQIALGAALSAARGMAAAETAQAYGRARKLCGQVGEKQRLIPVLLGLWSSHNARDELGDARVVAAQLLNLAEQKDDAVARVLGHRALGATLFALGEFISARTHLQQLLALDSQKARDLSVLLPYDPCVSGRAWLSLTLSVLGYPEQAVAQADKAIADAEQLQQPNTLALVLSLRCSLGQFLGYHHDVARHAKAVLAVAVERDFAYWVGLATYFQGWAQAKAGEITAGIGEMRRGLAACQTTGARAYVPYNLALLADMCRRANDTLLGRKLLDEALDQLGQTGARYCEAELLCIDGELRLNMSQPDRAGAEASFQRAIQIAQQQNAKALELHAAVCLAQLWADGGKRRQAYDLLAPIYSWFTEGFNTQQIVDAKILLDSLA